MPQVLASSTCVVLPSTYREGVPKALIEAASASRPIVTYDMPGCREIVRDGLNGFLAPAGVVAALSTRVRELLRAPSRRRRMGQAGRQLARDEFAEEIVVGATMRIYRELLASR
jgi:glycosyltransferase involved in cell wall biosynthesis